MEGKMDNLKGYLATRISTSEYPQKDNSKSPPIELAYNEKYGRRLIASKDIKPGEIIFWETPIVVSPKAGSGPNCLDCFLPFAEDDWPHCRECGMPRCFPICQGQKHSKRECDTIRSWGFIPKNNLALVKQINVALTVLRTYLGCQEDRDLEGIIQSLQSNKDKRRNMSIGRFVDKYIVEFFQCHGFDDISSDFVHQTTGVFDTNAFEINWKNNMKARALLPAGSLMNHDCTPNTQHWFYNGQCVFRATVPISKGTPITNSYTKTLWGTKHRQEHLKMTKLFDCHCNRCLDPTELGTYMSSVQCMDCDGFLMQKGNWTCFQCCKEVPRGQMDVRLQVASSVAASSRTLDAFSLSKSIKKLASFLGFNYYVIIDLQFSYIQLIARNCSHESSDQLHEVHLLASRLLDIISKLEPGYTKLRGLLLYYRCKIFLEIYSQRNLKDLERSSTDNETQNSLRRALEDAKLSRAILLYDNELPGIEANLTQLEHLYSGVGSPKIS